jgi:hypothetical protein
MRLRTLFVRTPPVAVAVVVSVLVLAFLLVRQVQENATEDAAPHLFVEDLTRAYYTDSAAARKKFDHQWVVVSGILSAVDPDLTSADLRLMGADGDILCHTSHSPQPCAINGGCTVAGICEGMDIHGRIRLSDCYVVSAFRK